MSVNSVQNKQQSDSFGSVFQDSLIRQGKNVLVGTGVGLAAGSAVSMAIPASRNTIAEKLTDYFLKTDEVALGQMKALKESTAQNNITKEQLENILKNIDDLIKPFKEKAQKEVERFFKLPRNSRSKDDIVNWAKKAAKKSQNANIIGTAVGVGVLIMLFSDLFSGIFHKKTARAEQSKVVSGVNSKMGTHQG